MEKEMMRQGFVKRVMRQAFLISHFSFLILFSSCFGSKLGASDGGEVTGAGGKAFTEPTPYGMTLIKRGHLKMGLETTDSLWGKKTPQRDISVDGFWMDETEVTNSKYRQFVNYVRDSILRERLAEVDETYRTVKTDKEGNELGSVLNWKKALPRKPSEDEQEIIDGIYATNPVTGEKMLDCRQMNYRYEVFDYTSYALRRNRLNPEERHLIPILSSIPMNRYGSRRILPISTTRERLCARPSTVSSRDRGTS